MKEYLTNLGNKTLNFFRYLGGVTELCLETFFWIFVPPMKRERIFEQAKRIGLDSLLIVSLVGLFTGMILALQTAYLMKKLSSEIYIASIIALSLTRELGPVLTALIVAGRSGAAITAEIGTMTVTEQVDALKTLATNPVKYLVVPRFLALTFMLPVLTIYADLVGIFGGYLIGVNRLSISPSMYLATTFDTLVNKDIFTGLIKTVFFGMLIALISCYEGLNVEGGAEGVGKSTTNSVVTTFIFIIVADCFFTALFYFFF
ncbi:MAG: ABC transporter permease [Candidatus Omnitrophica bacterium]|nr:ABC transporter permease [Candidatus Omnitrophota bacterium]MDD5351929.1 ABC transporter permease [Candidatus Omnitrophota bacterium]MDD5550755.1 ABC transporter permease [Candidatus Omnitrophota bacterium]